MPTADRHCHDARADDGGSSRTRPGHRNVMQRRTPPRHRRPRIGGSQPRTGASGAGGCQLVGDSGLDAQHRRSNWRGCAVQLPAMGRRRAGWVASPTARVTRHQIRIRCEPIGCCRAVARPLAAGAQQQADRMRHVGVLEGFAEGNREGQARAAVAGNTSSLVAAHRGNNSGEKRSTLTPSPGTARCAICSSTKTCCVA
jgi:hypothetical protein